MDLSCVPHYGREAHYVTVRLIKKESSERGYRNAGNRRSGDNTGVPTNEIELHIRRPVPAFPVCAPHTALEMFKPPNCHRKQRFLDEKGDTLSTTLQSGKGELDRTKVNFDLIS